MHFDILITRHDGLKEFLAAEGHTWDEVITHVTDPSALERKDVCGILPLHMACLCCSYTELHLDIPAEMRGKELTEEQTREYARGLKTYVVFLQEHFREFERFIRER